MSKNVSRFAPFGVFVFVVAALASLLLTPKEALTPAAKTLPPFSLTTVEGKGTLTNADITRPSLIHVAASWCASCKLDHPKLMQLKSEGLPIYGVLWKDTPEAARVWLEREGNPYRKVAMDDGRFAIDVGLTGTPETLLVDASGGILLHVRGALSDVALEEIKDRLK